METADKLLRNQLKSLLDQADTNATLQTTFDSYIDPSLKSTVHVATFSNQCLTLIADNGSIATRFRFIEAELVSQLQTTHEFSGLSKIVCKVRPPTPETADRTVERHISADNADIIKQAAEHIKDEKIKKALENLSSGFSRS